jgi:hypothetical protein
VLSKGSVRGEKEEEEQRERERKRGQRMNEIKQSKTEKRNCDAS